MNVGRSSTSTWWKQLMSKTKSNASSTKGNVMKLSFKKLMVSLAWCAFFFAIPIAVREMSVPVASNPLWARKTVLIPAPEEPLLM
jgi:hypothetical protein